MTFAEKIDYSLLPVIDVARLLFGSEGARAHSRR